LNLTTTRVTLDLPQAIPRSLERNPQRFACTSIFQDIPNGKPSTKATGQRSC
jgi:hypothetical protein